MSRPEEDTVDRIKAELGAELSRVRREAAKHEEGTAALNREKRRLEAAVEALKSVR